jgi:FlaA1/EpsC-like NDP-sugar epimerase
VRIADIAHQLTLLAGRSVQILYTGLREGEKLHEELFGEGEVDHRPVHPSVSHVTVPALDPAQLQRPVSARTAAATLNQLVQASDAEPAAHVPEPRPSRVGAVVGEQR